MHISTHVRKEYTNKVRGIENKREMEIYGQPPTVKQLSMDEEILN